MKTPLKLILMGLMLFLGLQACSLKNKKTSAIFEPRILFSSDGEKSFPIWVYQKPFYEQDDRVFVSGVIDLSADQNPARGMAAADLQARSELAKLIETKISNQLQLANEGFGYSDQVLYQIVNLASRIEGLQNIRLEQRGYAQVLFQEGSEMKSRYTCYSQVSIAQTELEKMIQRSLQKFETRGEISPLFREKVERSWNKFFENETLEGSEAQ